MAHRDLLDEGGAVLAEVPPLEDLQGTHTTRVRARPPPAPPPPSPPRRRQLRQLRPPAASSPPARVSPARAHRNVKWEPSLGGKCQISSTQLFLICLKTKITSNYFSCSASFFTLTTRTSPPSVPPRARPSPATGQRTLQPGLDPPRLSSLCGPGNARKSRLACFPSKSFQRHSLNLILKMLKMRNKLQEAESFSF